MRNRALLICAYLASAVCGLSGFAAVAGAQSTAAQPNSPLDTIAPPVTPGADETLRLRVQDALHSDPYFYDAHVTVSVENGDVVLRGFVFSDWDLRDALRIAGNAAGDKRVIDYLSIKLGGRR